MNKKDFKEGERVIFIGKSPDGEIYTVEIGKIKRLCNDGAFVYYHTGDTAAKTNYSDLYKIKNAYAIYNLGVRRNNMNEEKEELQELIQLLYQNELTQYGKKKLEAYIKQQQKEIEELKEYKYMYEDLCK